jgi:mRNA-degrading endonuclease RelE of RelBE toxin-antitoxin system
MELRAIDRESALRTLYCLNRYLASRAGDVKRLKPPLTGSRLRCGDYRVFFDWKSTETIEVLGVRHRKEAYR